MKNDGVELFRIKEARFYSPGGYFRHQDSTDEGLWSVWKVIEIVDDENLTAKVVMRGFGQGNYGDEI